MKPVIKKDKVYSVILMRDDDTVKRFRLRALWLKLLGYSFLLAILVGGAAVYGTYYYYNRYRAAADDRNALSLEIAGYKVQAERLVNLEEWLRQTDPARLKTINEPVRVEGATPGGQPPYTGGAAGQNPAAPAQTGQADQARQAGQAGQAGQLTPGISPGTAPEQPGLRGAAPAALTVKLVDARANPSSNNRLRIQFDLTNPNPSKAMSGKVNLYVVTPDGILPVNNPPQTDLRFQINRMKRIRATFNMPEGIDTASVTHVRVEIESDSAPLYTEEIAVTKPAPRAPAPAAPAPVELRPYNTQSAVPSVSPAPAVPAVPAVPAPPAE